MLFWKDTQDKLLKMILDMPFDLIIIYAISCGSFVEKVERFIHLSFEFFMVIDICQ